MRRLLPLLLSGCELIASVNHDEIHDASVSDAAVPDANTAPDASPPDAAVAASLWGVQIGAANDDGVFALAARAGRLAVVGLASGVLQINGSHSLNGSDAGYVAIFDEANGQPLWQAPLDGDVNVLATAIDDVGDVYAAGEFNSPFLEFVQAEGTQSLDSWGGLPTSFIVKIDGQTGYVTWAIRFPGANSRVSGLAVVGSNLYAVGFRDGNSATDVLEFDEAGTVTLPSGYGEDAFVVALDTASGAPRWATPIGGGTGQDEELLSIAATAKQIVVGGCYDKTVYLDGSHWLTISSGNEGLFDGMAIALDTSGKVEWAERVGQSAWGNEQVQAVAIEPDGLVMIGGRLHIGSSTFGSNDGTDKTFDAGSGNAEFDGFVAALDGTTGKPTWVRMVGTTGYGHVGSLALVPGGVLAGGTFSGMLDTQTAVGRDLFLVGYSETGARNVLSTFGGDGDDGGIVVDELASNTGKMGLGIAHDGVSTFFGASFQGTATYGGKTMTSQNLDGVVFSIP